MPTIESLLERLIAHQVEFVIVGGFAAVAHGVSLMTQDLDICCPFTPENLARLQRSVSDLHPFHRGYGWTRFVSMVLFFRQNHDEAKSWREEDYAPLSVAEDWNKRPRRERRNGVLFVAFVSFCDQTRTVKSRPTTDRFQVTHLLPADHQQVATSSNPWEEEASTVEETLHRRS